MDSVNPALHSLIGSKKHWCDVMSLESVTESLLLMKAPPPYVRMEVAVMAVLLPFRGEPGVTPSAKSSRGRYKSAATKPEIFYLPVLFMAN